MLGSSLSSHHPVRSIPYFPSQCHARPRLASCVLCPPAKQPLCACMDAPWEETMGSCSHKYVGSQSNWIPCILRPENSHIADVSSLFPHCMYIIRTCPHCPYVRCFEGQRSTLGIRLRTRHRGRGRETGIKQSRSPLGTPDHIAFLSPDQQDASRNDLPPHRDSARKLPSPNLSHTMVVPSVPPSTRRPHPTH